MIPVRRPEFEDARWLAWRGDARDALLAIRTARERQLAPPPVNDALYKRAKPYLLRLFHDKCAYCESVISNTQPGDVEHYRPKGRLRDLDGRVIRIILGETECDHPGYWWLCYEWMNLLPSCIDCNRRRRHGEERVSLGKADLFPIAGRRAANPDDPLSDEKPLLLDPTAPDFDPAVHFDFGEDGKIAPKTETAKVTCELFGLNLREKLVEQRADAYAFAASAFHSFIDELMRQQSLTPQAKSLGRRLNDMWEGRTAHTTFARLALSQVRDRLEKRSIRVSFPLELGP